MSVIDKRIVQLVFDNLSFEKNAEASLSTLDRLKSALKFNGVTDGLSGISNSIKGVSFAALDEGLYNVQSGFNALEVVAQRVLQRITDKALDTGTNLAKSLTITPIKSGMEEYETQINSVQTILANTGDALKEKGLETEHDRIEKINSVLDELNSYADMTIYNFTEMTKNIGTFTAAGVDLDTAATAIQGIANLAAMSGSNSQQASTAMYQLSQAIASGSVKLQDWNSVVNAGMGGKLFQNELIETGKAMNIMDEDFKDLVNGATTFRESLSSGWLSAEVLTNTLEKFTAGTEGYTHDEIERMKELWQARGYSKEQIEDLIGSVHELTEEEAANLEQKWIDKGFSEEQVKHILEMGHAATDAATKVKTFTQLLDTVGEALQSGWTQSWEYILGDFEQAKTLWTEISDILNLYIGKSADARNDVLKGWSEAAYTYNEQEQLVIRATGEIVEGGKMLNEQMGGREAIIQGIRNAFQGVLEVVTDFSKVWGEGFWGKGTDNDISITSEKLIELSRSFEQLTHDFKDSLVSTDPQQMTERMSALHGQFEIIATSARNAFDGIKDVFSGLAPVFESAFKTFFNIDTLKTLVGMFEDVTDRIKSFGETFKEYFNSDKSGEAEYENLTKFFQGLKDVLEEFVTIKFDIITGFFDGLGTFFTILLPPGESLTKLLGDIGEKMTALADGIHNLFYGLDDTSRFSGLFNNLATELANFFKSTANTVGFDGFNEAFGQMIAMLNFNDLSIFETISQVFDSLVNIFEALGSVIAPVVSAFGEIFGPKVIEGVHFIQELVDRFHDFTESLILNEEQMLAVKNLFEGIFDVISAVAEVIGSALFSALDGLSAIIESILPSDNTFVDILNQGGDALSNFADMIRKLTDTSDGLPPFTDIFGKMGAKIAEFIDSVKNWQFLDNAANAISNLFTKFKEVVFGNSEISILEGITNAIGNLITKVKEALFGNDQISFGDAVGGAGVLFVFKKIIDGIRDMFGGSGGEGGVSGILKLVNSIKNIGDVIEDVFSSIQQTLKAEALSAIGKAMLEIAGALFVISLIDSDKLVSSGAAIGGLMYAITKMLEELDKANMKPQELAGIAAAMFSIGQALLMLSGAVYILAQLDTESLLKGLGGVVILIGTLTKTAEEFSKFEGKLAAGAGGLVLLAGAVDLLTIAVKVLGDMDWESFARGLSGTIALIFALTKAAEGIGEDFSFGDGAGLLAMAYGVKQLGEVATTLAGLSWEELAKGLAGTIGLIFALSRAAEGIGDDFSLGDGAGLLAMAYGVKELGESVQTFGSMDLGQLAQGLIAVGVALGEMTAASHFTKADSAIGLAAMAAAMLPLAIALKILSEIPWQSLIVGLGGMAGALTIFVVAANFMNPAMATSLIAVAGAMTLMGVAMLGFGAGLLMISAAVSGGGAMIVAFIGQLITLIPTLATALVDGLFAVVNRIVERSNELLQSIISLGQTILTGIQELVPQIVTTLFDILKSIVSGLIEILPQLTELVTSLLSSIIQMIIELAPQFFEMLRTVITESLSNLFQMITELAPQFFEMIRTVVTGFITTIMQIIQECAPEIFETMRVVVTEFFTNLFQIIQEVAPQFFETARIVIVEFVSNILQMIQELAPQFFDTIGTIFTEIVQFLQEHIPEVIELVSTVLQSILTAIQENAPKIGDTFLSLLDTVLNVIETAIPKIVKTLLSLLSQLLEHLAEYVPKMANAALEIIKGFLKAIADHIKDITKAAIDIVVNFIKGITDKIDDVVDAAFKLVIGFIEGLAKAIEDNHDDLFEAIGHLITAIVEAIVDGVADLAKAAQDLISGFIAEFDLKKVAEDLGKIGENLIQGIIDGITGVAQNLIDTAGNIAGNVLGIFTDTWDEHSPSKKGHTIGNYLGVGVAGGISSSASDVEKAANGIAVTVMSAMSAMKNADYSPTITPVYDDSELPDDVQLMDLTRNIKDEIKIDISSMIDGISDEFQSTREAFTDTANGIIDNVHKDIYDLIGESRTNTMSIAHMLDEVKNTLDSLQIVLDSGALVGELTPAIDKSLGNVSMLASRGVI